MTERPKRIPFAEVVSIVREYPTRYSPVIAERYGVPRTTAHRWVREAKLRGYLSGDYLNRPCPTCGGTGVRRYGAQP